MPALTPSVRSWPWFHLEGHHESEGSKLATCLPLRQIHGAEAWSWKSIRHLVNIERRTELVGRGVILLPKKVFIERQAMVEVTLDRSLSFLGSFEDALCIWDLTHRGQIHCSYFSNCGLASFWQ